MGLRIWHLLFAVATASVMMALAREPMTRAFLITFVTGLGFIVLGTAAVMALFQTIGALGQARGIGEHVEAIAATSAVLAVATALIVGWLFVGTWVLWVTS